jgi:hypothetical protein
MLKYAAEDDAAADSGSKVQVDHVARAPTRAQRELTGRGGPGVVLQDGPDAKAVLDHANKWKLLEPWDSMRSLRDPAVGIDRTAKRHANALHWRSRLCAPAKQRLDQSTHRVDCADSGRVVPDRVSSVNHPAITVGKHNALPAAADFDADGDR